MGKTLVATVTDALVAGLSQQVGDGNSRLNNSLRLLAKWRCELIKNTLIQQEGTIVLDGPLKGLDFLKNRQKAAMLQNCWVFMSSRCTSIYNLS